MRGFLARCQIAWSVLRGTDARAPCVPAPTGDLVAFDPAIPRYPPFLKGLPVATSAQILDTQQALITTFQNALAITDADYAALVPPLLERYAAFVHLLPASETHHHRGAGGLLRHGLEVAALAARASRGKLFALDRRPEERRVLEPRWHLAAFVAGLLHDVGKPVVDVSVFDRAGTSRWQPVDDTIVDWARRLNIDHYFLRWNAQRLHHGHELFTASVFHQLLTPAVRNWLMDPDPLIWHTLGRVLAGSDTQSLLYHLMHDADRASVAQDVRENHLDPEALSLGVPIERYLIETMRALLREGTWTVNVPGAQVWTFHPGGLHLVWSDCAPTVVQRLAELGVPGIPRDPDTLAEILIDRQLAVPGPQHRPEHPVRYWRLAPACLSTHRERPLELSFLRLSAPELLFSGVIPAPVPLVVRPGDPTLEAEDQARAHTENPQETRTVAEKTAVETGTPDPAGAVGVKPVRAQVPWSLDPAPVVSHDHAPTALKPVAPTTSVPAPVAAQTAAVSKTDPETAPEAVRAWLQQHAPAGPALIQLCAAIADGRIALPARPITAMASLVERAQVAYIGLDSLSDGLVGAAIGSILIADLAAVAGDRYNYGVNHRPVNVFIDEASEVVNDPMIQLLNKGRGAGLRLTIATQTFADFAARTGSPAKARQVLSNLNTLIALRVLDAETQEYVTASLPKVRLKTITRTQGTSTQQDLLSHSANVGEQLKEEIGDLFQPALLGMLPNLHYIARLAGGRIVKGRLPILGEPKRALPPSNPVESKP